MDDSCAVCAETLQWVAYGPCGHQEVCSTCVVRLRFICNDHHCCLCKSMSNIVFVTKALGDYTRVISDFSVFPVNPREGQVGSYWYHEATQAYFDNLDHYKMIKAMCRLSCGVCDKIEGQKIKGTKRMAEFSNIEQLESHLFHQHKLFMCSLCLEGRKIFICEQKLYNKAQLNQHIKTGDSVVDGSERESGGFKGHPMCEYCQNPFYGENELYSHMSREHYTCHICQRQHTGQYEYYKDYDNLEIHFRQEHFLCENEACLANKFVVFATESEMKRHNAAAHRRVASLSRCNAIPQIPASFHHHRSNGNDGQGRERFSTIQPSYRTVTEENISSTSLSMQRSSRAKTSNTGSSINPFDILATFESEPSLRSNHAIGQNSRNGLLEESSFPPLPASSRSCQNELKNCSEEMSENTMAACHHRFNNRTLAALSSQAQPIRASSSHWSSPAAYSGSLSNSGSLCSSKSKSATINDYIVAVPSASSQGTSTADVGVMTVQVASRSTIKASCSATASYSVDKWSFKNSISTFPPLAVNNEVRSSSQQVLKLEDIQTANKLLMEKIRDALGFDNKKLADFREASARYRRGSLNAGEFLAKVNEFGLSHLTLELARLCSDTLKQKDLIETYNLNTSGYSKISLSSDSDLPRKQKKCRKGKEKCQEDGISSTLADNSISCLSHLQLKCKPSDKEVKISSEPDYCSAKSKSKVLFDDDETDNTSPARPSWMEQWSKNVSESTSVDSKQSVRIGAGGNKQQKMIPKFLRNRLRNDAATVSDLDDSDPNPSRVQEKADENQDPPGQLPILGVWRNGGGRRLVAMTKGNPTK